jgi:hypothetical protein
MFSCGVFQIFLTGHFIQRVLFVSSRVSSACMGLIYRKVSLRIQYNSVMARKESRK